MESGVHADARESRLRFGGMLAEERHEGWPDDGSIGIQVLYSEHIRAITQEIPSAQLLTETDNLVGARWLTGTPGMPRLIENVVRALAEVRGTTPETIVQMVQTNFARLIQNDPWLPERFTRLLAGQPKRA